MSFLTGQDSNGDSNVIIGVLENMLSLMSKNAADAQDSEKAAIDEFEKLTLAKTKELKALSSALETKTAREGELSVKLVDTENDLSDTKTSLAQSEVLLTDLDRMCDAKEAEYELNKKMRSEELAALADTIKILNDDDALELFKKAIPAKSGSFLQVKVDTRVMQARALQMIKQLSKSSTDKNRLNFLVLALKGKKIGFDGIIKMIDGMIATLKKEQTDDEVKQAYCAKEFDSSDDKKKEQERSIEDLETTMDDTKESISQIEDDMKALESSIKDTDKSVAEATEQRKEDHEEYTQLMADDNAAKEVLQFAKNRLNKFYNPALYVPPPKEELSAEDHIVAGMSGSAFLQIRASKDAPPPPPAAVAAFKKQSNSSTGVIEMIDLLVSDLDKDMAQRETEEKQDQADYETVMAQSAEKRKADSQSLDEKDSAKADMEGQLQKHKKDHKATKKEYGATLQYIHSLHQECDWLQKYFGVRKEARLSEIDALTKAKAILNGADFSLTQVHAHHFVMLH
jgi:septal ring factor EnvC (AmiA/AmiB activator)